MRRGKIVDKYIEDIKDGTIPKYQFQFYFSCLYEKERIISESIKSKLIPKGVPLYHYFNELETQQIYILDANVLIHSLRDVSISITIRLCDYQNHLLVS